MEHQMLSITPFMAEADFNSREDGPSDIREVQVVGIIEGTYQMQWVCVETVDGWEFPRVVDCVRWKAGAKQ